MNKKILILSVYPAPYRVELIQKISENFCTDVFFEQSKGDERNSNWFKNGDYETLDNKIGKRKYKCNIENIKKYDLVIAYDYASIKEISLILRCLILKIPYVINCDGVMLANQGNPLRELIKKIVISKASLCLASGKNAKEYFLKYGASESKIKIHPFSSLHKEDILEEPIDINTKNKLREQLNLPKALKIAIAVGRFIPLKRYDCLIKSWTTMPSDYLLMIIGGGSELNNYQSIIKQLNLTNVLLLDYKDKEELKKYYQASDVFVHPTSYDVWGLVINEALSNGLPIVVSDHCIAGLELIKDSINGYVITMGNDEELINKTKLILNDTNYYQLSKQAIETIKEYTIENMAQKQIDSIKSFLDE